MPAQLLNIIGLSYTPTYNIAQAVISPDCTVHLPDYSWFVELPLVGMATCECASQSEGNQTIYTTKLSGRLIVAFSPARWRQLSFLAECADGSRYLIGWPGSPWPAVATSLVLPGDHNTPAGSTVTVTITDTMGLLRVV